MALAVGVDVLGAVGVERPVEYAHEHIPARTREARRGLPQRLDEDGEDAAAAAGRVLVERGCDRSLFGAVAVAEAAPVKCAAGTTGGALPKTRVGTRWGFYAFARASSLSLSATCCNGPHVSSYGLHVSAHGVLALAHTLKCS